MSLFKRLMSVAMTLVFLTSCADFTNSSKSAPKNSSEGQDTSAGAALPPELQKPNEGSFSEIKMLVNIGLNIQFEAAADLNAQVRTLQSRIQRYCAALDSNTGVERARLQAQEQFKEAMLVFHFMEASNAGPMVNRGRWLIDNIYSWPYVDYCGMDREVVRISKTGSTESRVLHTSKGLGALEYLLFEQSLTPRCNLRANPDVKEWIQKTTQAKLQDRCASAEVLVEDLLAKTAQLEQDWNPSQGNFVGKIADGSAYESLNAATNDLVDAMFMQIEKLKDSRLGKPLGRHKECLNDDKKCPEMAEHALSGLALEAVAAQTRGFQTVWSGDFKRVNGFGLEEFIRSAGRNDVADQMNVFIKETEQQALVVMDQGTLEIQIQEMSAKDCLATTKSDRKVAVCALHADVREMANLLKIEVFSILSLRVPSFGQGDND